MSSPHFVCVVCFETTTGATPMPAELVRCRCCRSVMTLDPDGLRVLDAFELAELTPYQLVALERRELN